jgi:acyl-CoA reductase-like NAD-dependent aldehyde dehydrogenase
MDLGKRVEGFSAIVRRFPIGPVSMVSPFNFPLNLTAHKVAPALAVGCVHLPPSIRPCVPYPNPKP